MGAGCAGQGPAPTPGPEGPAPEAEDPADPDPDPEAPAERPEPTTPERYYWAYVASDGPDVVSRLRFGPDGAVYEKAISVGSMPERPDGIGELAVSPDGSHWYLSLTGGANLGSVWKYETGTDRMTRRVQLQGAPGSLSLTPDGRSAYVTVGPEGDSGPAAVAELTAADLVEAGRLATCRGGRANRVDPTGRWQYSVCRTDDVLVEISTAERRVTRTLRLAPDGRCGPVELALSPDGDELYVACADSRRVLVLERDDLDLRHRVELDGEPGALATTPDGDRLLALVMDGPALAVIRPDDGEVVARIPLSEPRPTALTVSDDGRYAFVALRGREGAPRSVVEVVDLRAFVGVATLEVPEGATSAAFWRSVAGR